MRSTATPYETRHVLVFRPVSGACGSLHCALLTLPSTLSLALPTTSVPYLRVSLSVTSTSTTTATMRTNIETFLQATSIRAKPTTYDDLLNTNFSEDFSHLRKGYNEHIPDQTDAVRKKSGREHALFNSGTSIMHSIIIAGLVFTFCAFLGCMLSHGTNQRDTNFRIPPSHNPGTGNAYSFRTLVSDVGICCVLTDLGPHQ